MYDVIKKEKGVLYEFSNKKLRYVFLIIKQCFYKSTFELLTTFVIIIIKTYQKTTPITCSQTKNPLYTCAMEFSLRHNLECTDKNPCKKAYLRIGPTGNRTPDLLIQPLTVGLQGAQNLTYILDNL